MPYNNLKRQTWRPPTRTGATKQQGVNRSRGRVNLRKTRTRKSISKPPIGVHETFDEPPLLRCALFAALPLPEEAPQDRPVAV
eukprot:1731666-Lingulodinium_polyedra.AAC.1